MADDMVDRRLDLVPDGVFTLGASRYPPDIPLVASEGEGCYVTMESGEEFIDYLLGSAPLVVGHAHPHVEEAIRDQACHGTQFHLANQEAYDLAERIVEAVPCAEKIKFASTGSEATYHALRLARSYTGNEAALKFAGAYHGWHDYVLKSSRLGDTDSPQFLNYPEGTVDSAGAVSGATERTLVAPFNDIETTQDVIRRHSNNLAAVIVEPLMGALPPRDGFLGALRDLCDEEGIVLIFDEVVTGFRLAWGGGQEYYGVKPDLATYGKIIGGGTPMSAVCGGTEIMDLSGYDVALENGKTLIGGTLNGNPLSAAAGNATLDVLSEEGTYKHLHDYADKFREIIDDLLDDSPLDGVSMGEGPIVDFLLSDEGDVRTIEDVISGDLETKQAIDRELLDKGLLQHFGGKRYICTKHSRAELEATEAAYKDAIETVAHTSI